MSIADIGTGCGCIGITLFLELQKRKMHSTVILSDITDEAVSTAHRNMKNLIPQNSRHNFAFLVSDLFDLYSNGQIFDIIVSNLPYIPSRRIPELDRSVKNFEPLVALDGGKNGTVIINRLLTQIPKRLNKNGIAVLEIDDTHTLSSFKLPVGFKKKILQDSFGRNRFLLLEKTGSE
jgi:release factor glutamine methyltransferase